MWVLFLELLNIRVGKQVVLYDFLGMKNENWIKVIFLKINSDLVMEFRLEFGVYMKVGQRCF